ncbi:MAG: DUF808 domain-containing protein [Burkholderiaceae bacterium]
MAGASLLTLIDDLSLLLDDIAVLTKVAGKKTAGVLADDLALNAEQVSGVAASRELPVVWAVFKGSMLNKLLLVPAALLISAFVPWMVTPLLMAGGLFLCFEGVEKLLHKYLHPVEQKEANDRLIEAFEDPSVDLVAFERDKIKGAIRTDFILSAEIIVIALNTVADRDLTIQIGVLSLIAILLTLGVYGFVALIVKLDDFGLFLTKRPDTSFAAGLSQAFGRGLLRFAPLLMKFLSIAGTAAMFFVGGGILVHGIHWAEQGLHAVEAWLQSNGFSGVLEVVVTTLYNGLIGVIAGAIAVAIFTIGAKVWSKVSGDKAAA